MPVIFLPHSLKFQIKFNLLVFYPICFFFFFFTEVQRTTYLFMHTCMYVYIYTRAHKNNIQIKSFNYLFNLYVIFSMNLFSTESLGPARKKEDRKSRICISVISSCIKLPLWPSVSWKYAYILKEYTFYPLYHLFVLNILSHTILWFLQSPNMKYILRCT